MSGMVLHSLSTTTVHRGLAFEQKCLRLLQENMSMSLRRVGGKSDGGIDLMGWWWLPAANNNANSGPVANLSSTLRRIRVLGQCKAEKKKIGPHYVREMEGVLHRLTTIENNSPPLQPIVALFLSESAFTKGTILRALSSPLPFLLLHIPPSPPPTFSPLLSSKDTDNDDDAVPDNHAAIGSVIWNPALGGPNGILQGAIDIRWERPSDPMKTGGSIGRPGLWAGGKKLGCSIPVVENPENN